MYDLILTTRRVVGISSSNLAGALLAAGLLGGVVGGLLTGRAAEMVARNSLGGGPFDSSRLDAIVVERKGSFAIRYDEIEKARFAGIFRNFLKIRSGGKKFYLKIPIRERPSLHDIFTRVAHRPLW